MEKLNIENVCIRGDIVVGCVQNFGEQQLLHVLMLFISLTMQYVIVNDQLDYHLIYQ